MTTTKTGTAPTEKNPTGITNYDIGGFARLPEWQKLAQALKAVAVASGAHRWGDTQRALVEAVAHLARGVGFMDRCEECDEGLDESDARPDTSAAQYATTVENGGISGRYRCAEGHEWTRTHRLDFPLYYTVTTEGTPR